MNAVSELLTIASGYITVLNVFLAFVVGASLAACMLFVALVKRVLQGEIADRRIKKFVDELPEDERAYASEQHAAWRQRTGEATRGKAS